MEVKFKYSIFLCSACSILILNYYKPANNSKSDVLKYLVYKTQHTLDNQTSGHYSHEQYQANVASKRMKYILQWTSAFTFPFVHMGSGQETFVRNKCPHVNCVVTSNQSYLENVTMFDAIVFAGTELIHLKPVEFPRVRAPHQKYVFANIESADNYPICIDYFKEYFNWTWTYRLDSDSRWGYIIVRAMNGTIIGPNKVMHWMKQEHMKPVPNKLKEILRGKTKIAAWYASNCQRRSGREIYVNSLNRTLHRLYKLSIDMYGACGNMQCPRDQEEYCNEKIRRDYFFYLAFENSFSEDYVTEKLLRPLQYNAVPVVYGGANYSRFLPDGSYIDASKVDVLKVAKKMYTLMKNFDEYVEYFKWTNHYTYHKRSESKDTDDYCSMCAILNDEKKVKETSVYKDMKKWWNNPNENCCTRSHAVIQIEPTSF